MFEAAGAEEHEGEEHEVVEGVDHGAGCEGSSAKADCTEDEADKNEQEKGAEGPTGLRAVHEGEGNAGKQGTEDHCREGPLRIFVFIERAARSAGEVFDGPVVRGAQGGKHK